MCYDLFDVCVYSVWLYASPYLAAAATANANVSCCDEPFLVLHPMLCLFVCVRKIADRNVLAKADAAAKVFQIFK